MGKAFATNENKCNKKIYLLLKSDCDRYPNRKNWCTLLKQLLCNLGFYQVWLDVGQPKIFLLNVKHRLKDQFIQGGMAEFRNPVVLHYIDIWHLLNSNLILIFVTFLNSDFL